MSFSGGQSPVGSIHIGYFKDNDEGQGRFTLVTLVNNVSYPDSHKENDITRQLSRTGVTLELHASLSPAAFGVEKISEGSSINHSRLAATPESAV